MTSYELDRFKRDLDTLSPHQLRVLYWVGKFLLARMHVRNFLRGLA